MDIRILKYFLLVAKEENITKSAQLLHITQPTLSRQLQQLEEELEVKLFERGKHNIYLTEEGHLFRRRAQEIVNLTEKSKKELKETGQELTGEISIGCSETQTMNELSEIMMSFRKKHPLIKFELRSGNNIEIRSWIEQGNMDLGLLVEPVDIEKYRYIRMEQKDIWGVLVQEKSKLSSHEVVKNEDLIGTPLITVMDETMHNELASWCDECAQMMIPMMHYNLLSNAATVARKGEGAVICSKPGCKYDELVFIPFEPKLELGAFLAWKDNQRFSKAATAFIEYIKKYKKCMG